MPEPQMKIRAALVFGARGSNSSAVGRSTTVTPWLL
jgi:hypothetical protein